MLLFAASSSKTAVFREFARLIAGCLNVIKSELPSRALVWSYLQCSMFTNQFTISKGSHFA
jgi:hypothetical protein